MALDAVGAWPPIRESHVEMDGAWALYEAWVRLQCGDVDSALVYAFGKSSLGDIRDVLTLQLDPYYTQPLWPDAVSVAALQARALLDAGKTHRARDGGGRGALPPRREDEPASAQVSGDFDVEDAARRAVHRVAAAQARLPADLGRRRRRRARRRRPRAAACARARRGSPASTTASSRTASACATSRSRHRRSSPREQRRRRRRRRSTSPNCTRRSRTRRSSCARRSASTATTRINPSGGALAANAVMVAGLARIGEAAQRIIDGDAEPRRRARDLRPVPAAEPGVRRWRRRRR